VIALVAALAMTAAPFAWPRPEVIDEIDVPDTMKSAGVPVKLRVVRSRLGPQALLETFGRAFVEAGLYVPPVQRRIVAEPHVTGLDWRAFVSYSAILHPNDDGTTTCVLGEAALAKKTDVGPDIAPVLPGARGVLRVEQEGARVMSYSAAATAGEVQRFYGATLGSAGFQPSADEPGAYERRGEHLTLLVTPERTGGLSVVLVLTNRQARVAP
jgi:hypothetical protein